MSRLQSLSVELVNVLSRVSVPRRRAACIAACQLAVAETRVQHSLVHDALRRLHAGHMFTLREKAGLDALAARLDDEYFNLQRAAEAGAGPIESWAQVFAQARAVSAVSLAGSDSPDALCESVYESAVAVQGGAAAIKACIESTLSRS